MLGCSQLPCHLGSPRLAKLAAGVGFEPTGLPKEPGGFQGRCHKPLGHPAANSSWWVGVELNHQS